MPRGCAKAVYQHNGRALVTLGLIGMGKSRHIQVFITVFGLIGVVEQERVMEDKRALA